MFIKNSLVGLAVVGLIQVASAIPQLTPIVKPTLVIDPGNPTLIVDPVKPTLIIDPPPPITVTATVNECPLGKCTKICTTSTATLKATTKCAFNTLGCPVAKCMYIPPITSTSTSYCKGSCTGLTTTGCEKIPPVTAYLPCPTECPELCPIPIETVAVACPTTTRIVITRVPVDPTLIILPTLIKPTALLE